MNGVVEIPYRPVSPRGSFGAYGKIVHTKTEEVIAFIERVDPATRVDPYVEEEATPPFDLFMMGVYTVWSSDQATAMMASAFDLVPVIHVSDLGVIAIGCEDIIDGIDENVVLLEYAD